jgi:hypothetical protein
MTFLPSVVEAEHRGGFRIRLVFNDGSENTVDTAYELGPKALKARRRRRRKKP